MALPAWSYVVVGLIVVVMSYDNAKLLLFFYLGLAFLAWGMFRLGISYLLRAPKPKEEPVGRILPNIVACRHCGAAVYSTARFCHECGGRLI